MAASASQTIVFAVGGPINRADLPGLCKRVCALLERSGCGVAVCDVHGVDPDAVCVDALARLQLAARRHGSQIRLRRASKQLLELVALMGLSDVLPDQNVALGLEPRGQPEEREQRLGVEKERELADPAL